jgi:hypothetical protein
MQVSRQNFFLSSAAFLAVLLGIFVLIKVQPGGHILAVALYKGMGYISLWGYNQ